LDESERSSVSVGEETVFHNIETLNGLAVAAVGDVIISTWHDPVTLHNWAWYRARLDRLRAKYPKVLCISIILPESSPPDIRLRKQMESDLKAAEEIQKYIIVFPKSDSLFAGVARAIVRTAFYIIRRSGVNEFVNTLDEAAVMVGHYATRDTPKTATIKAVTEEMLRRIIPEKKEEY
jgi:hypothetical protein